MWYREHFQPFVNSAKSTPFFINWRPDFYASAAAFGYIVGDVAPTNQAGTTRMLSVNMTMRAHDE
jgi:hypothetical protein